MSTRLSLLLVGATLTLALLLFWMSTRPSETPPTPAPPSPIDPTPLPTQPKQASSSPRPTQSGYRLAGTVVGDARYAVIEGPDGRNDLYRPGQTVPGLGRLVDLAADRATFEGGDGRIELRLAPASTPTVTPFVEETPTPATTTQSEESSDLDQTPPAELPSSETDRSAS